MLTFGQVIQQYLDQWSLQLFFSESEDILLKMLKIVMKIILRFLAWFRRIFVYTYMISTFQYYPARRNTSTDGNFTAAIIVDAVCYVLPFLLLVSILLMCSKQKYTHFLRNLNRSFYGNLTLLISSIFKTIF